MKPARPRGARALLALVSVAVTFAAFEVGFRLAYLRKKTEREHGWHEYDEHLGWRQKRAVPVLADPKEDRTLARSFSVRLNAQGLRMDSDVAALPSASVTRIACVGDSYTFGYCVEGESAFPARLGAALGPRFEVLNFGVSGYGLDQSLIQLEREVLPLGPKVVILSVEDVNFRRATSAAFEGVPKPYFALSGETLELRNDPVPKLAPGDSYYKVDARGSFVLWWIGQAARKARTKLASDPDAADERWVLGHAILREFARKVEASGAKLVLALLPEGQLMGRDPLSRLLPPLEKEEKLAFLDLYPAFQERMSQSPRPLFVPGDGHPSEIGHQIIADELEKLLEKRRLLGE